MAVPPPVPGKGNDSRKPYNPFAPSEDDVKGITYDSIEGSAGSSSPQDFGPHNNSDHSTADEDPSRTQIIGGFSSASENQDYEREKNTNRLWLWIGVGVLVLAGVCVGAYFLFSGLGKEQPGDDVVIESASIQEVPVPTEEVTMTQEAPEAASEPVVAENHTLGTATGDSPWREGHNEIKGEFLMGSNRVPFTISLEYSHASGRVTDALYNGAGAGVSPISTAVVSADGTVVSFTGDVGGQPLRINATSEPGAKSFKGSMTQGGNNGNCHLTLE